MRLDRRTCTSLLLLVSFLAIFGFSGAARAQAVPTYKVDASWPKELPHNWIMGQASGIAVDRAGHIWVLQRPHTDTKDELGAAQNPPISQCCYAAPPVLEFDAAGNLLQAWGGPGAGYDWPKLEHSIFVDSSGDVWITGNGRTDRQALKFTGEGKFIMQIGHPSNAPMNSADPTILGSPAGIDVDAKTHEVFIADGYGNRRVIVFDANTGKFKRLWGAYGHPPEDSGRHPYDPSAPPDQQFGNEVHCAHVSNDGLVYVCDRLNDRIQVFTRQGKFLKEFFIHKETLGNGSVADLAFSPDKRQRYMFVADGENSVIWIVRRSNGEILGSIGHAGRNAGQFHHLHDIASDSHGNLYTGEVETGKRVQKFVPVRSQSAPRSN